jgi:ATP/maltotriose-dependent transcriptional regulator MalT
VLLDYGGTRDTIETLLDGGSARRILRALSDRYLLIAHDGPNGREYRLHRIVQPFYYGELSKRQRIALHQRAGAYYETEERDALRAAIHYDRAGDYARAADLATADVWALINQGQARALRQLLERFVVRQIEPPDSSHLDPERWATVRVVLGEIYGHLGERQLARQSNEDAYADLSRLPTSLEVRRLLARVCISMGTLLRHETPGEALEWSQRGMQALGESESPRETAALHMLVARIRITMGDYAAALETVQQVLALLPPGPSQLRADALVMLGTIHGLRGDIEQGHAFTVQALEISRQLHDSLRMVEILSNLGVDKYIGGDWAGAIADCREALALAEQLGSQTHRVGLVQNLGMMLINHGDDAPALEHLTSNLALTRANHLTEYEIATLVGLADLHLRRHEAEEAAPLLAEAERLALEQHMNDRLSEIYRFRAEVRLAHNQADLASEDADRATQIARELESSFDEGLSLRTQGQAL